MIKRVKSFILLNVKLLYQLNDCSECTATKAIVEVLISFNITLLSTVYRTD